MDDAIELSSYLPLSFANKSEEAYVRFLWEAFESNYKSEKYEFASLAFHLLYMSYVSFSIWQIKLVREEDFKNAMIGFQSDSENKLLTCDTPFKFFENLKEAQIFRFLKLIGCQNAQVGEFSRFVKRRNKIAHPSGTVFFNDKKSLDDEIIEIMSEVANIEKHMESTIHEVYCQFLETNKDPESRQYGDPALEIETNLIHRHYMSQKDIDICLTFDISSKINDINAEGIEALHQTLQSNYSVSTA